MQLNPETATVSRPLPQTLCADTVDRGRGWYQHTVTAVPDLLPVSWAKYTPAGRLGIKVLTAITRLMHHLFTFRETHTDGSPLNGSGSSLGEIHGSRVTALFEMSGIHV